VFSGSGDTALGTRRNRLIRKSVYGRTKRDGDRSTIERLAGRYPVLRTSWVVSAQWLITSSKLCCVLGAEREALTIVADQIGRGPTGSAGDLQTGLCKDRQTLVSEPEKSGI